MGRSGKKKGKSSASSGSTSSGNPNIPASGGIDAHVMGGATFPDPGSGMVGYMRTPNTNPMGATSVESLGSSSGPTPIPPNIIGTPGVNGTYGSVQPKPFPPIKGPGP